MKPLLRQIGIISAILLSISSSVFAQSISPQMIAQLKSMPKAQQQALAKQYGINLDDYLGQAQSKTKLAQPGMAIQQTRSGDFGVEDGFELPTEKESEEESDKVERFGLALFDANQASFAPTDDAQVPDDYRLGVGDELLVQTFGKDNQELTLLVNRDGQVSFPKLGLIKISGLTFVDAAKVIQERVKQQLIGVDAVVSMGGLRSINVFMAGEVKTPGMYSMTALSTVSQALFQAGGISEIGSLRNVQVKRAGKLVSAFDLYDVLLKGDASNDVRLRSGDVVFVPTFEKLVTIEGEVKRPMQYEVKSGETVADVLGMSGGVLSSALKSRIVLTQSSSADSLPIVKTISAIDKSDLQIVLKDGDKLRVDPIGDAVSDEITLHGAVVRPGAYGWREGLRITDIVSDFKRDLHADVDLQYGLIVRQKNQQRHIETLQFNPADALLAPQTSSDTELQNGDEIYFFAYEEELEEDDRSEVAKNDQTKDVGLKQKGDEGTEEVDEDTPKLTRSDLLPKILARLKQQGTKSRPELVATISGAVRFPGEYPIHVKSSVNDLILAAGGVKPSAYTEQVELRRLYDSGNGLIQADYEELNLNNNKIDEVKLASRDHLFVREYARWSPKDAITVSGEVRFPGVYMIQQGETLSDVVERAGGLTAKAFADGAVFTREDIAKLETQRALEFAESIRRDFAASLLTEETVSSTYEEIAMITENLESFEGKGRLLVDLPKALAKDESANIVVQDGDKLFIPKVSNTVTVVGEVRRQGTHSYQTGLTLDDYISLGAGITDRADKGAIYIVKANGSVVIPKTSLAYFSTNDQQLNPGDTIIVPVDSRHKESIPLWRDITQIVYQSTVAIAAVARL